MVVMAMMVMTVMIAVIMAGVVIMIMVIVTSMVVMLVMIMTGVVAVNVVYVIVIIVVTRVVTLMVVVIMIVVIVMVGPGLVGRSGRSTTHALSAFPTNSGSRTPATGSVSNDSCALYRTASVRCMIAVRAADRSFSRAIRPCGIQPPRRSKLFPMSRIRTLALGVALLASALLASLACSSDDADGERLQVVVSTQVIADWARQVGGDLVEVRALVPAGADAHTFEVTVDDIRAVADADLVIINGAGLESSYEEAVEENATNLLELAGAVEALGHELLLFEPLLGSDEEHHEQQDQMQVDDSEEQQQQEHHQEQQQEDEQQQHHEEQEEQDEEHGQEEDEHGHDHAGEDPHFWFDVDIAKAAVTAIAAELIALAPDAEDDITERRDSYLKEIDEADEEVRSLLADLPERQRLLFTFHDAFAYFAERYDLVVAGYVVEGPEQGISAEALTELIELIEHEGVGTIFHEPQFDSTILDTVADETGVERGIIWSQPTEDQPTYIDILVGNAKAIAEQ